VQRNHGAGVEGIDLLQGDEVDVAVDPKQALDGPLGPSI
jgi:hypothetical protein